jgi:hypothetical protein
MIQVKMARKSLALALIIVLAISMSVVFVLPNSSHSPTQTSSPSPNSDNYAGYSQIQLLKNADYVGKIGSYNYTFIYYPATINDGVATQGYLSICREGVSVATEYPLAVDTTQQYYGIEFGITQVQPDYIILMVNSI